MDEREALLGAAAAGGGVGLLLGFAGRHHLGAQCGDGVRLLFGNPGGDVDHRPGLDLPGHVSHRPSVVATGDGDEAPAPLLGSQRQDLRGGPPQLERTGDLGALVLDRDRGAHPLRQRRRRHQGSPAGQALDPPPGGEDVPLGGLGHQRSIGGAGRRGPGGSAAAGTNADLQGLT